MVAVTSCNSDVLVPTVNPILPSDFDWSVQASGTTEDLTDIHFTNSSTGWVVGNQVVLATSNGGSSWPVPPADSTSILPKQINSVFFINNEKGWLAGSMNDGTSGEIFITQQGGAYPILQDTFVHSLNTIFFLDPANGWAAGENGDVVTTKDGGSTWNNLTNINSEVFDLHFTTKKKGWLVGSGGALYHTVDGVNFQQADIGITTRIEAVHFTDTLNGWACGNKNTILRRHMSDQNEPVWSSVVITDISVITEWIDIHFIDQLNGWVVSSEGKIYRTADGGANWVNETTAASGELNAIHMISHTKGWVAGNNGLILTYTP